MKKTFLTLAALFCIVSFASAQEPETVVAQEEPQVEDQTEEQLPALEPGIYSIIDGVAYPLPYSNGTEVKRSTGILGFEIGSEKYKYKGETAGVDVLNNKLVMVVDPERTVIKRTLKKYDPFVKSMTPGNLIIVRLVVDKNKRYYDAGESFEGIKLGSKARVEFEWELVDDNTYEISVDYFQPGEYAVVFRPATLGAYDFTGIFGFTVPEE